MSQNQAEPTVTPAEYAEAADRAAPDSSPLLRSLPYWQAQLLAIGMTALVVICCVAAFGVLIVR
jgi:hypothetical protein